MQLEHQQVAAFHEAVWNAYRAYGRPDLPWRVPTADGFDPYFVMVSELMLQQTQVARVIPKYHAFIARFPTVQALASASLGEVLRLWQGLGYNRRAKFLHEAAGSLISKDGPWKYDDLIVCKGIGPNTAAAILVYSYDEPLVFVETNIRTVYIHHFFAARTDVADKEIVALLEQTLDREHPREFYWALMDYGTHLKTTVGNLNKASKHYARQSQFHGSRRQVRGQVIRLLGEGPQTVRQLAVAIPDERLRAVLEELTAEGLIRHRQTTYAL